MFNLRAPESVTGYNTRMQHYFTFMLGKSHPHSITHTQILHLVFPSPTFIPDHTRKA